LGGRRGRLISGSDRKIAIELIEEATAAGAREKMACQELVLAKGRYDAGEVRRNHWRTGDFILLNVKLY
jgi:hypothetical protein